MTEYMRERLFAQYIISKTLSLYITQKEFRDQVDDVVNDGCSISMGGRKLSNYEQVDWKLSMACTVLAKDMTEEYFKPFDELNDEDDAEQTDCPWK